MKKIAEDETTEWDENNVIQILSLIKEEPILASLCGLLGLYLGLVVLAELPGNYIYSIQAAHYLGLKGLVCIGWCV